MRRRQDPRLPVAGDTVRPDLIIRQPDKGETVHGEPHEQSGNDNHANRKGNRLFPTPPLSVLVLGVPGTGVCPAPKTWGLPLFILRTVVPKWRILGPMKGFFPKPSCDAQTAKPPTARCWRHCSARSDNSPTRSG